MKKFLIAMVLLATATIGYTKGSSHYKPAPPPPQVVDSSGIVPVEMATGASFFLQASTVNNEVVACKEENVTTSYHSNGSLASRTCSKWDPLPQLVPKGKAYTGMRIVSYGSWQSGISLIVYWK